MEQEIRFVVTRDRMWGWGDWRNVVNRDRLPALR